MKYLRNILLPFVPFYFLATWFRNKLYDFGIKKGHSHNLSVICVGNLSVGGTGKTPMIEYLIHLLKSDFKIATLSRGYRRKTKGFQLANPASTFQTIGDEPFQFYNKYHKDILVAVDSNRDNGIQSLLKKTDAPEVVLLDDAFQHRKVKAGLNILLTTYHQPFFKDMVLPTGNLRESKTGAQRAHIIMVTKCPKKMTKSQKATFVKKIKPKSFQEVFFSSITYSDKVIAFHTTQNLHDITAFTLVTGIADDTPLVDFLTQKKLTFQHLSFKDHHEFSDKDIDVLNSHECLITTEKDYMRLKHYNILKEKLFYIPITIEIDRSSKFDSLIKQYVKDSVPC